MSRIYKFSDVVGNKTTTSLLRKGLKENKIKNFLIYSGVMGTGKTSCAEITGLTLLCDNPSEGQACLDCKTCKSNLKALRTSGESSNLVMKNMGLMKDKKDLKDLIDSVFILQQGSVGNNVYILGEAHEIPTSHQTAVLEEIDRLNDNTYVIMTTTRPFKLLPELRSRAITYNFNRLTKGESKLLFDQTIRKMGIGNTSYEVENMIIKYATGIPRDMVKIIEFVKEHKPTEEELRDFLGFISNEVFIELFRSMSNSMWDMAQVLDNILIENSLETVVNQLKEFIVNCMFSVETKSSEEFSKENIKDILELFGDSEIYKIASALERFDSYSYTETDFKLLMIKLRKILNNRGSISVFTENKKLASEQKDLSSMNFSEEKQIRETGKKVGLNPINLDKLSSFKGGNINAGKNEDNH